MAIERARRRALLRLGEHDARRPRVGSFIDAHRRSCREPGQQPAPSALDQQHGEQQEQIEDREGEQVARGALGRARSRSTCSASTSMIAPVTIAVTP